MMDFKERKAEIFRRSEKIIEKHKKRNKIIALSLPFVLCTFIFSITVFPEILMPKKNLPSDVISKTASDLSLDNEYEVYSSDINDELLCLNISVEKYDYSINKAETVIDDSVQINEITSLIDSYFENDITSDVRENSITVESSEQTKTDSSIYSEEKKEELSSKSSQKKGAGSTYYITLKFSNGTQKKYTLKRNTLSSEEEVIELSKYQASNLSAMFGLG